MEIDRFTSPILDANMYVVSEDGYCIAIDPYYDQRSLHLFDGLEPELILVTHEHFDHISGVNSLKRHFGITLYATSACAEGLEDPSKNHSRYAAAWLEFHGGVSAQEIGLDPHYTCQADQILENGQTLDWRGHSIQFRAAPGHSPGSTLILMDSNVLFSGDCMLRRAVPATRFPGSSPAAFRENALPYLKSLDGETMVFPGHYGCFRLKDHYLLRDMGQAAPLPNQHIRGD